MEPQPGKHNLSEYEQLATELYDDIDWLFSKRKISSSTEQFGFRYSQLQLSEEELDFVGPTLENHAIDAPHFVDIKLTGRNPYIYADVPNGIVWITTKHYSVEKDTITSEYTLWIDPSEEQPIHAIKDVKREVLEREANKWGILSLPLDISDTYHNETPLDHDELNGLRAMINRL